METELKLFKMTKTIEEMDTKELKSSLKGVNKNIKILERSILKLEAKTQANAITEKLAKAPAKATEAKPIVKASNKVDGSLASVKRPEEVKPVVKQVSAVAKPVVSAKPEAKAAAKPVVTKMTVTTNPAAKPVAKTPAKK